MELFSLTCTTCKSKLKVRDQAAVGQILACPKCGGMVMVKPPPSWNADSEQKSDLPTATELTNPNPRFNQTLNSSAFDVLEELLSDAPPKTQPPPSNPPAATPQPAAAPTPPKPRFVGGPPVSRAPSPGSATPTKPSFTPASALPPPVQVPRGKKKSPDKSPAISDSTNPAFAPPPPAESAALTAAGASQNSAPARRYWMFMAGSVGLGIVLAISVVSAASYFLREPARPSPARVPGVPDSSAIATTTSPTPELPAAASAPPAIVSTESTTPTTQIAEASPDAAGPAPPVGPPVAAAPPAADPGGLVKQPTVVPPALANNSLAKFDRILGGGGDDPLAKASEPSAAPPTPPTSSVPERPIAPRPPPHDIDLAKRLADPLNGIEVSATPLADFLEVMSDLSTIPITLEPNALPLLRLTAESGVSLQATNSTVGGALSQAAASLGLECVAADEQLIVRVTEPAALRSIAYPMKDLAADAEQITDLAEMLQAVVEPESWGDELTQGGWTVDAAKLALVVRQRQAVHARLVFACEKLRTARGKPPFSSRFDPALFQLDSRTTRAKPLLERPISLNYRQPTRLVTILDRLGEASGMRILVDWHDVAAAGWNPAAEASLVVSNQPLSNALDSLLDPLDLAWRVVDARTVQVVTPARLADECELEIYRAGGLTASDPSGESLLAKLRSTLGDATFTSGGGNGELRFDAEGKCLLAWLPQLKQRELEALLTKATGTEK